MEDNKKIIVYLYIYMKEKNWIWLKYLIDIKFRDYSDKKELR